jgi:hypothetical protein
LNHASRHINSRDSHRLPQILRWIVPLFLSAGKTCPIQPLVVPAAPHGSSDVSFQNQSISLTLDNTTMFQNAQFAGTNMLALICPS